MLPISRKVDRAVRKSLDEVIKDKTELMSFFSKDTSDDLRQKIVEQSLNLVISYLRLRQNYSQKQRELAAINTDRVMERLARNKRNLEFVKDSQANSELVRTIDLDEKLLERVGEEKRELERIGARLNYIESAINTFKHRIMSSSESDPAISDIDSVINEASALDSALKSRERENLRL